MAKPIYILLAKNFMQDKDTNSLSIFEVIERIEVSPFKMDEPSDKPVIVVWEPMRLLSVWMGEPTDNYDVNGISDEFQFEHIVHNPGEEARTVGAGVFRFQKEKSLQRLMLVFGSPLPFNHSGVMRFQTRIKTGNGEWISQEYPVGIDVTDPPKDATTPPSE